MRHAQRILWYTTALFAMTLAWSALAEEGRYVQKRVLPTSNVVVVAEGDMEPRSIGSYAIRIYGGANPAFPMDDFLCGIVVSRDGTVEDVLLADVNGDAVKEIVVKIRCVGTGGFLSADAFAWRNGKLLQCASVKDLKKDADVVDALRKQLAGKPQPLPQKN